MVQGQVKVISGQGPIAVVVPVGTIGSQIVVVAAHLLLAAGGDGGDLDTWALKGLWRFQGSRGQQRGAAVLGVMGPVAGKLGAWFVGVMALGGVDDLGVGLHAMTRQADRLVVGDHRLGLAHI